MPGRRGAKRKRSGLQPYRHKSRRSDGYRLSRNYTGRRGYIRGRARHAYRRPIKYRTYSKKTTLKTKVANLVHQVNADHAKHTHRSLNSGRILATAKQKGSLGVNAWNHLTIETAMTDLRYYDPATPTTLKVAGGGTGTYSRTFLIKRIQSTLKIRNNYMTPCTVDIYCCRAKKSTDTTPAEAITVGYTAQMKTPADAVGSTLAFPTDSDTFNSLWAIDKHITRTLTGGQEMSASCTTTNMDYDPQYFDGETAVYNPKSQDKVWFMMIRGVLCHDKTNTSQMSTGLCACDYSIRNVYEFIYDAGTTLNDYSMTDDTTAPTAQDVTCFKNVTNGEYSQGSKNFQAYVTATAPLPVNQV